MENVQWDRVGFGVSGVRGRERGRRKIHAFGGHTVYIISSRTFARGRYSLIV